jgi:hypothetical protein
MRKIILIPVLLLLALPLFAQKSTEIENVINLINQYDKALTKKDSVALGKLLTEDFIGSIPNGQSFDKKSFISYHCSPTSRVRELKEESTSSWNIKFTKDYAIVNRFVTYFAKTGGKKQVEIKVKKLEVCVKIKNKWMMASVQGTEVLK